MCLATFPTYGRQHGAGGFLDSARNDRVLYCATACGGKVVRSTKGGDGVSRQTIDDRLQTSDGQCALQRSPLTAGSIVRGDFLTPLRSARNDREGRDLRFEVEI